MVGSTFHNLRFIEPNVCCTKCALLGRAKAVVSLNFVHAIHVRKKIQKLRVNFVSANIPDF